MCARTHTHSLALARNVHSTHYWSDGRMQELETITQKSPEKHLEAATARTIEAISHGGPAVCLRARPLFFWVFVLFGTCAMIPMQLMLFVIQRRNAVVPRSDPGAHLQAWITKKPCTHMPIAPINCARLCACTSPRFGLLNLSLTERKVHPTIHAAETRGRSLVQKLHQKEKRIFFSLSDARTPMQGFMKRQTRR